jgi:hypothetical protein
VTGSTAVARIAMMAMATTNSTRVMPRCHFLFNRLLLKISEW